MSAIAGALYRDGRDARHDDIERMAGSMTRRAPDGGGSWVSGSVGLGGRLLRTTPESLNEPVPALRHDDEIAVVADARIDNRGELIGALGLSSGEGAALSDSELILQTYERWGERCVDHLLGDFSFAIWDGRRRMLFCARDHFGMRPFHYHAAPGLFAFASEVRALHELPEVPREINELRLAEYLSIMLDDDESTLYQGILRLPAAHALVVTKDGMRRERYWGLDGTRELRLKSNREYADAFREVFTDAVRCRVRSASPVGSFLSGGLDSSSVSCIARDLLAAENRGPLHTFSGVFPDVPETDERRYIDAVLARGGFEPHFVDGTAWSPFDDLEHVMERMEGPFYAPNLFQLWGMYTAVSRRGMRVLLEGAPGDVTISYGLGYLRELALSGRWLRLVHEIRLAPREGVYTPAALASIAAAPLISDAAILAKRMRSLAPGPAKRMARRLRQRRNGAQAPAQELIQSDFAQRAGLQELQRAIMLQQARPSRSEREVHLRSLKSKAMTELMELSVRASSSFGIDSRYPFMDRRVAEFCLSLPGEQKLRNGWMRLILRHGMEGSLPDEVRWRRGKANLQPNMQRALRRAVASGSVDQLIDAGSSVLCQYVDIGRLREISRSLAAPGSSERAWRSDQPHRLWLGVTLATWLNQAAAPRRDYSASSLTTSDREEVRS